MHNVNVNALARTASLTAIALGGMWMIRSHTMDSLQRAVDAEMARVCPCFEPSGETLATPKAVVP